MTDNDPTAAEGMKQCSKCGKVKALSKFSASTHHSDEKQPWCKHCHKDYKAEHGAKALKMLKALPSSGWFASAILKECRENGVRLVKSSPVAKASPMVQRGWRFIDADNNRRRLEKLGAIVNAAFVKAQAQAATADAEASIADSRRRIAKSQEASRLLTIKANDATTALEKSQREIALQTADLKERVDVVMTNFDRANAQMEATRARRLAMADQRDAAVRDSWLVKANLTSDPILRTAYLERAEGRFDDDDE